MNNLLDSTGKLDDVIKLAREHPWLPRAGKLLLSYAEQRLLEPRGISLETYGTHRYLLKSADARRVELARIWGYGNKPTIIERIPSSTFARYSRLGLSQLARKTILSDGVPQTLLNAYRYFDGVPSLRQTVGQLVLCIHILEAEGDPFDVSHSDPDIPLSVFISVPKSDTPNAALRACESILHESMHLQLTLLEHEVHLVSHCRPTLNSPWRSALRPPLALLHGIYVFSAISDFYRLLESQLSDANALHYIHRRQEQILAELRTARASLKPTDLTKPGNLLSEFLAARLDGDYR